MDKKAIFEVRENMGASPLAIARSLVLLHDLEHTPKEELPITLAAHIDAAIRQSGAPELLAATQWLVSQLQGDSGTGESYWRQFPEYRAARAAITKATGG